MTVKRYLSGFFLFAMICIVTIVLITSCVSAPVEPNFTELENKGTLMGIPTPEWVRLYVQRGTTAIQSLSQYSDKYVIIGEESGVNRQFVISWADMASAQQRIGALLRTNIASRYEAAISATAASEDDHTSSAEYQQEIDNVLSAIVNVSYSGAQRENDWWVHRRIYDPDNREIYRDEYTAWVLYTIPKEEMNRQIAFAMETSVSRDSALYDVTVALARDILLQGYDIDERQSAANIQRTAASSYDPPGSIVARAIDEVNLLDEYVIGRDVAALILSNYRIWNADPALTDYVNKICQALVINSPKPSSYNGYQVVVLDSDEINAFASPGGHIFLTRGLVSVSKSEEALAAVIAHELSHVQLKHGMRAIRSNRDIDDWVRQFMFTGGNIIADSINAGFSQIQEFDADIGAISLLAAAGYNPRGLIDMLQELEKIQGGIRGGFNSTHPSPASRLVNAKIALVRYENMTDTSRFRQDRFRSIIN